MNRIQLLLWTLIVALVSVAASRAYWQSAGGPTVSNSPAKFFELSPETLTRLREQHPKGPVQMINLVRFDPDGGREAYREYTKLALPALTKNGGEIKMVSRRQTVFTLLGEENWDAVFVAEFPSLDAWLAMLEAEAYKQALVHRKRAVIDFRLYCTFTPAGATEGF